MPANEIISTGIARVPRVILDRATDLGLEHTELMQAAGLDEAELDEPDARVGLLKIRELWRSMIELSGDPTLGLRIGAATELRQLGIVGYAMLNSRTVREAFQRLIRFDRVLIDQLCFSLEEGRSVTRLVITASPRLDELPQAVDARVAAALAMARQIRGGDIEPVVVRLTSRPPRDLSDHRGFLGDRIEFGRSRAVIVFDNDDLDRPLATADETLCGYLDQMAEDAMSELGEPGSFSARVRGVIEASVIDGLPAIKSVAAELGVSPRTLQRRLKQEGASFAGILDDFRHHAAVQLLSGRDVAVYEVASRLGYSDPSTFHRAFRRWRKMSPVGFRRSLLH